MSSYLTVAHIFQRLQLFKTQIPLFVQSNENMELTSAIQSEQHVKKELARRMGELQEHLHNVREQVSY